MLKVQGVAKSYGDLQVLKSIDLEVKDAEIIAIVGPSGAGKSTLLQIMSTLDNPDTGKVLYGDEDAAQINGKKLVKFRNQNIGFVFQFHHLLPEFTAIENVAIPAMIAGKSKKEAEKLAMGLLTQLGLHDRGDHKPKQLSGGEQQRVAIARSLINQPKIIFADEPSGNLDSENADKLHQLFLDLRKEYGYTFVIVTHNRQLAEMADRVVTMKDGMLV